MTSILVLVVVQHAHNTSETLSFHFLKCLPMCHFIIFIITLFIALCVIRWWMQQLDLPWFQKYQELVPYKHHSLVACNHFENPEAMDDGIFYKFYDVLLSCYSCRFYLHSFGKIIHGYYEKSLSSEEFDRISLSNL